MALNIYTGNGMENLLTALARVVEKPLPSAFAPELISVQSKGMERWVAMGLARHFGIWANCEYLFPNALVWRLFSLILAELPAASPFDPEVLTWKLMAIIPHHLHRDEFAPLRRYLAEDGKGLKSYQLAELLADSFDQYTIFRPEMLKRWEEGGETGPDEKWQALLWRDLVAVGNGHHRGHLKEEFIHQLREGGPLSKGFPPRIALFGISYLPAYHLEILAAIAGISEINLFLLSPTSEYWGDIISRRAQLRLAPEERTLRTEGNSLLASLGKLGRNFSDMIIEIGEGAAKQEDCYKDPGNALLLHTLQSRILNLVDAGEREEKEILRADDSSIQIHSCHNRMREIEVLHDSILAFLEKKGRTAPREILVMTPDIESYVPYITAVFDGAQNGEMKIPYSIADRNLKQEGEIADVLLKLLDLPASRLTVTQLSDILETAPVQKHFGLNREELAMIRRWLEETGIRWGMDEQSRLSLGLPGYREYSWRAGLDRLLLGYALPEEGGKQFNGVLPYDEIEGANALTLGKLAEFINRVALIVDDLGKPRTLPEWQVQCQALLSDFLAADDHQARELATLTSLIARIGELSDEAGFHAPVELAVIRSWLAERLDKEEKGLGFMTGGVTFCAMLPMRSIPFRIIALIGMNDGAFPRQNQAPAFDLIARQPRRGDRSLRDEDRYLFLESLLSARECLYISYLGQSMKDGSKIPPSVLVSELVDTIERGFATVDGRAIPDRLVTHHRLQAFNSDYFRENSPLFSYSRENYQALLERRQGPGKETPFLEKPLPPPPDEWKEVPLSTLLRFFDNPAKFFLEKRLGIYLEDVVDPLQNREPFDLQNLEAYKLKMDLLEMSLHGEKACESLFAARCRGIIPPGCHGDFLYENLAREVENFARSLQNRIGAATPLASLEVELELSGFRLSGRLEGIWSNQMLRYRCANIKAKDVLHAWIEHLLLNTLPSAEHPVETVLIMEDGSRAFRPVDDGKAILKTLLNLYWQGLSEPLRFFPASAMAYGDKEKWNLAQARKAWQDGYTGIPGEGSDPCFHLCFGRSDPFDAEFERIARLILGPVLQHLVD